LAFTISFVVAASMPAIAGGPASGSQIETQPHSGSLPGHSADARFKSSLPRLLFWNQVAIDTTGLDHTPVQPGEHRVFGENLGPGRAARAMAIVHIAIFDAVNAIAGGFESYTGLPRAQAGTSMDAAIATAAHDALVGTFPSQKERLDDLYANDLAHVRAGGGRIVADGIALGHRAAAAILAMRTGDGSEIPEPTIGVGYFTSNDPGRWREDPISQKTIALGAFWGSVRPFVMTSGDQFRVPPPPAMDSAEYTAAYDEVQQLGGDGVVTPTIRTPEQTFIGTFWAYDGTPSLCAPPRFYNQITTTIAAQMGTNLVDLARLLALVNTSLADAGIAVWESKYHYDFWRPVTGIRESDPGTGPSGLGDGNPDTHGDPTYVPLCAPASNLGGPNFTPPFPSYPSGHGGFGGALFEILRTFYGTDDIAFTIVSDEFNGMTTDNLGNVRPLIPRSYTSFSQAEEENGQSRIYLGIHWKFDKDEAIAQGRSVGDYVFQHAFQPAAPGKKQKSR
jgi:hypothetical protein